MKHAQVKKSITNIKNPSIIKTYINLTLIQKQTKKDQENITKLRFISEVA